MNSILTAMSLVIVGRLARLAALTLRLRWQMRYENRRHATLMASAPQLPPNGVIELDYVHQGGSHLRLRIATARLMERRAGGRLVMCSPDRVV